jgi:hypothetical protein
VSIWSGWASTSAFSTVAPASANISAISRPIPLYAPVTMTVSSSK